MTDMCTAAANFIINEVNNHNVGKALRDQVIMSSKRLQKLLYFSEILYMVEHDGRSMFKDEFYAWPSGPVIPAVYRKFMMYQDGEMRPYIGEIHDSIDDEMKDTLRRVLSATTGVDTSELIEKSHVFGGPWESVYSEADTDYDRVVNKKAIYTYYCANGAPYGATITTNA